MNIKRATVIALLLCVVLSSSLSINGMVKAQEEGEGIPSLNNPITAQYLKKNLSKSQPRLVLNQSTQRVLKQKLKTDPVTQNMYKAIQLNTVEIMEKPLLERIKIGMRLLPVSREMLYRMNMLGMVYHVEKDARVLDRINDELIAVCSFSDWNPSHFLDVAEMAMAVAIGLDWTAGDLPKSTIELAERALIEKGIKPSWPESGKNPTWVYVNHNWNQVCNGGMIAASIAIAEREPELAAKTIWRALDGLPRSLAGYMPDGIYPEGATYWSYGTSFSVITIAMLESALGTDFGIADYPGFKESAMFRVLMNAPSGLYYNFSDCGDRRSVQGDLTLAWFAAKTGVATFFEKERFLMPAEDMGVLDRLAGAALVWLAQYEEKGEETVPTAWKGDGANPVVVFTGSEGDSRNYYFGGKGGRGIVNHGNMDAGSFVFELNGIRWVIDPGSQNYNELEVAGFDLWNRYQDSERWTLLTKNNFGHSTLSVDDKLHNVEGLATIIYFKDGTQPEVTFDLTATFEGQLNKAQRKFKKDTPASLIIEDYIETTDTTQFITWQLITFADVKIVSNGAILEQEGEKLLVENMSHPDFMMSVVSLYPAPLMLDKQMKGLKRLELKIPAWTIDEGKMAINVRLSGE